MGHTAFEHIDDLCCKHNRLLGVGVPLRSPLFVGRGRDPALCWIHRAARMHHGLYMGLCRDMASPVHHVQGHGGHPGVGPNPPPPSALGGQNI